MSGCVCGRVGELNKQRVATAVGPRSVEAAAATASPAIWGSRAERAVDGPAGGRRIIKVICIGRRRRRWTD